MVKLVEVVMILDLHRQGLSVSAAARDDARLPCPALPVENRPARSLVSQARATRPKLTSSPACRRPTSHVG